MSPYNTSPSKSSLFVSIFYVVVLMMTINQSYCFATANAFPLTNNDWFSSLNKLDVKSIPDASFQQLISSKSEPSTVIAQIKPNPTELEKLMLKNKVAKAIAQMQSQEKAAKMNDDNFTAQCYINGLTKVERIPGKCVKTSSGLSVCQSENYLSLNSECN